MIVVELDRTAHSKLREPFPDALISKLPKAGQYQTYTLALAAVLLDPNLQGFAHRSGA